MTTQTFPNPDNFLPEIVLGIVSPVGTNLNNTLQSLKAEFELKKFAFHHIKLSSLFPSIAKDLNYIGLDNTKKYNRTDTYIKFGNYIRDNIGTRSLSVFAISEIASLRLRGAAEMQGVVYVVDQLKTEEELEVLRDIYGNRFLQISVYSARDVRVDNLSKTIAHDNRKRDGNKFRDQAEALVVRDEDEINAPNGQRVGKIFQLADVVINDDRSDEGARVNNQVRRFVELLFGHNGYSPNHLEYGMYLAHSAALRSLDLSRQVGAAIFRCTGEIAALGSNEVPKAGGGTYWSDDFHDAREYTWKEDSNDIRKMELMDEILSILRPDGQGEITPEQKKMLDKSQFMDALEYGRIIHAEMSALSDAARLGISVQDGILYCTTFPCHMCSKHIVASGIAKVVFLEPYPKSLTSDLHPDSVKIEGTSRGGYSKFRAVEFIPFFGITPRRYREFFYRGKRKIGAKYHDYSNDSPALMVPSSGPFYAMREGKTIDTLISQIANFQKRQGPATPN
ncbi:anti-phage dCTP deaminase [Neorhizobium galegae]|uniref:anti-phage dCTP deaminase n=1 Tax=Neorhizobium galegae TaxID=399 RepID=UPI000621175D|nr:anti-phage dCTP deaminase [Neorhizobium galegae]CDZ51300.1 Deoxycytidylate deaminase-related protein [Neorhizobium galegae bv. orientalis]CDZ72229.1 Deoxycytidylate deaminase-related protein [Neorhizobium galegae bv. orientalis]